MTTDLSTVAPGAELDSAAPTRRPRLAIGPSHFRPCLRMADALTVWLAGLAAGTLRFTAGPWPEVATISMALGLLASVAMFSMLGLYDDRRLHAQIELVPRVLLGWSLSIGLVLATLYLTQHSGALSRIWLIYWYGFGLAGLALCRGIAHLLVRHARSNGQLLSHVALVGNSARMAEAAERLRMDPSIAVDATLSLDSPAGAVAHAPRLRDLAGLEQLLAARTVERVVVALDRYDDRVFVELMSGLRRYPVGVALLPSLPAKEIPVLGTIEIGHAPLMRVLDRPIDGINWALKGAVDRLAAIALLMILAPLLLAVALGVKLTSPGPVLYRQLRRGFSHEPIAVLKFRTMHADRCDPADAPVVRQATRKDSRVTPLGSFLRRSSIDELPQLINVLKGEMSLVGPRPHALAHDDFYAKRIDDYLARHRVKPGITGWAQVNGQRGETHTVDDMRRRIELDLEYIDRWSLWLDFRILMRTVLIGFATADAY